MVLTFALCATFVFAQTSAPRTRTEVKAPVKAAQIQNDYSSSIFTKDATPIFTCDFHAENVGYSTAVILGGIEGHAENYDFATWRRIPSSDSATIVNYAETYPALAQNYFGGVANFGSYLSSYMDSSKSTSMNGFMMMSTYDQRTPHSGNFNAYILFEGIDASTAARVDVQFFQFYRKYYDNCYIDYCTDGTNWNEMEINTRGIDVSVNGHCRGVWTYYLPTASGNCASLKVRIRYKSLDSDRQAYGYMWAVDDVQIFAGEANRLKKYDEEYVEGNYGIVPQGLTINPAWYTSTRNIGTVNQNNVNAKLYYMPATMDAATEFDAYNNGNIAVDATKDLIVDRSGWLPADSLEYRGWYSYSDHSAHGSGYALPTDTPGDNYMFASVTTDSIAMSYDTMYYQVCSPYDNNTKYRWSHDNGVLTYSPYNYYIFGYIQQGGQWYVTEDEETVDYYEASYSVSSRYTTDAQVPEDWVIHGVELVASPVDGYHATGTRLSAVLQYDDYDGGSVYFRNMNTGANVKELTSSDVNDSNIIGRNTAGYLTVGDYNTIYIDFPEQPALEPNTSYRIGYSLEEPGYFALAQEAQGSYRIASPTRPEQYDTILYFPNNEATAKYASRHIVNSYQNYVYDPLRGDGTFSSYYVEYNPMIRMIVGPRQDVERHDIEISCEGEDFGEVAYAGELACGETIHPVHGSTATITGMGYRSCVAEVIVDGEAVEPWNADEETGDRNLIVRYNSDEEQYTYQYSFPNIQGNHTIEFRFSEDTTNHEGIDPIAANVRMNLQPNPATSEVNLNIKGVTGMVNCMLIDMSGRVVYNQNINAEVAQTINLNSLAKGAYFVRITNDKFSKVEKLIVR